MVSKERQTNASRQKKISKMIILDCMKMPVAIRERLPFAPFLSASSCSLFYASDKRKEQKKHANTFRCVVPDQGSRLR